MKEFRPTISDECKFGFCNRCSDPVHCKHSCGHKKPVTELQAMANQYNELANKNKLKPGYLNMDKVDAWTLHRAADKAALANRADLAGALRAEAKKRRQAELAAKPNVPVVPVVTTPPVP